MPVDGACAMVSIATITSSCPPDEVLFDTPFEGGLSSARPGEIWYPDTQVSMPAGQLAVFPHGQAGPRRPIIQPSEVRWPIRPARACGPGAGCRWGLPAWCSGSTLTPCADGQTTVVSRRGRRLAAIVASTAWPSRLSSQRRGPVFRSLTTLGATPARMTRAYRRHYAGAEGGPPQPAGASQADPEREAFRRDGRRLIGALIEFLDADAADAGTRDRLEAEACAIVDDQATRLADGGGSLTEAVSGFVAARVRSSRSWPASVAAARSIRPAWPTCTGTPRRCWIGFCCASSRRTSGSSADRCGSTCSFRR